MLKVRLAFVSPLNGYMWGDRGLAVRQDYQFGQRGHAPGGSAAGTNAT